MPKTAIFIIIIGIISPVHICFDRVLRLFNNQISYEFCCIIIKEVSMSDKKHIGTNFDSFLAEENILQEAEIIAKNRVNAYIIEQQANKTSDEKLSNNENQQIT